MTSKQASVASIPDSSDEETQPEPPKSSQWMDFQAMADRISTTVQKTSNSIKRIADTTNVNKLVGGVIKEEVKPSNQGAWEEVDGQSAESSEPEFDDDYDPEAEADVVGQAFGDYKVPKKKRAEATTIDKTFDDVYEPAVDIDDPLADAFGDGFRTTKPLEVSTDFGDNFSSTTSPRSGDSDPIKSTDPQTSKPKRPPTVVKPKKASQSTNQQPPVRPTAKPARPAAPIEKPKPPRPAATPDRNSKPSRPQTTPGLGNAQLEEVEQISGLEDMILMTSSESSQCSEDFTELKITEDSDIKVSNVPVITPPARTGPSNLDLLLSGDYQPEEGSGYKDEALEQFEPEPSFLQKASQLVNKVLNVAKQENDEPPRSDSNDRLDAFKFFSSPPTANPIKEVNSSLFKPQEIKETAKLNLAGPEIKVISASTENVSDDLLGFTSAPPIQVSTICKKKVIQKGMLDDLDPLMSSDSEEDSEGKEESGSEDEMGIEQAILSGGKLVRDDTVDFDELLNRSPREAESEEQQFVGDPEVWNDSTCDSGIGAEFKATFSEDDALDGAAFGGEGTFEALIERYSEAADGESPNSVYHDQSTKAKQEVKTREESISKTRAMKFARTFSQTIDEDDDEPPMPADEDPMGSSTGLGLLVDPREVDREDADGEEEEEVRVQPSTRHVWIDMTKPMPRAPKASGSKKPTPQEIAKKQKEMSTINLVPQAARQNKTIKINPVPRPRGKELVSPSGDGYKNPSPKSAKKIVTQGQADLLNLNQLKEHTTLQFQIAHKKKSKRRKGEEVTIKALPPPPKTPPPPRKNPFNKRGRGRNPSNSDDDTRVTEISELPPSDYIANKTSSRVPGFQLEDYQAEPDLPTLEEFRPKFEGHGWTLLIRKPPKKSLTKKRFWEEVFIRIEKDDKGIPCLLIYRHEKDASKGAKELERVRLNPYHQLSENIYLQQYDQYGKCYSIKILHVSYKERPGLRTDRVTEALPSFIKGYMKPTKNTVFEHVATITELFKFGSLDYRSIRLFVWELEDAIMSIKGERINTNCMYQKNEIIADAWDEYEACLDRFGHVVSHKARVRLFMIAFVSGMPIIEVGINDRRRKGKEVVSRHEIIPVKAENWITVEDVELHSIVKEETYNDEGIINFRPLDGAKFEFMRFRYRPKKNRELPLQCTTRMAIDRKKRLVEIRADLLIPGYYSNSKRKGQVPCENIQICFPVPEAWIYKFRVEKVQKFGSMHAAARKPGKVKGIERITGAFGKAAENYLPNSFIECSVGDAKYEHIYRSVVWRIDKLPRFNEGAYKQHYFNMRFELGPHDPIPDSFEPNTQIEFIMPHTTVSGTAIRSISCSDLEEPPEKWVHHHARYEYTVEINFESEIPDLMPTDWDSQVDDVPATAPKAKSKPPPSKAVKGAPKPSQKVVKSKEVVVSSEENSSESSDSDTEDNQRIDSDDTDEDESESEREIDEERTNVDQTGYETLVDIDDTNPASSTKPGQSHNAGSHVDELLNFADQAENQSSEDEKVDLL